MSKSKIKMRSFTIVVIISLFSLCSCTEEPKNQLLSKIVQVTPGTGSVNRPDNADVLNSAEAPEDQQPPHNVPAAPSPGSVNQPDGTDIIIYLKGDEWCNWVENKLGYSIDKAVDGWWYYVSNGDGTGPESVNSKRGIKLTTVYAHEAPPADLKQHIRPVSAREVNGGSSPSE